MPSILQRLNNLFGSTLLVAASAVQADSVQVTVTITSVMNISAGDIGSPPDFYALIDVRGGYPVGLFTAPVIMDSADLVAPGGWSFTPSVPYARSGGPTRITIDLRDRDSDSWFPDQQVDINPVPVPCPDSRVPDGCIIPGGYPSTARTRGIDIDLNRHDGSWTTVGPVFLLGANGSSLCTTGDESPAATICFSISVGPPVPITVSTTLDVDRGICQPGDCSLREAVTYAESGDTIVVPASPIPYSLTLPPDNFGNCDESDKRVGSHLQIRQAPLVIKGPQDGGTAVIKQTQPDSRVFDVHPGAELQMDHITITGGGAADNSTAFPCHIHGGGIHNHGTVRLRYVTITGNRATVSKEPGIGGGGGIFNAGGAEAYLTNVTIVGNVSAVSDKDTPETHDDVPLGGGIAGLGKFHLRNTLIADNTFETPTRLGISNCGRGTSMDIINEGGNLQYPGDECGVEISIPPDFTPPRLGRPSNVNIFRPARTVWLPLLTTTTTDPLLPLHSQLFIFAPYPGGGAIDQGKGDCGPRDQAGNTAPFPENGICDVGAVEHHP